MLVLIATSNGVGVSPDSVHHIATARSVGNGEGFMSYGGPYVLWPPLYPLVLSAGTMVDLDPLVFARYLNAFLVFIIMSTTLSLAMTTTQRTLSVFILFPILLTGVPLTAVAILAGSELLFISLTMMALQYCARYSQNLFYRDLVLCAAFAALALLTRHIGVATVAAVVLVFLGMGGSNLRRKARDVVTFAGIALLPAVLWAARTYFVSGTASGPRGLSDLGFVDVARFATRTISSWVIPLSRFGGEYSSILVFGIVALLGYAFWRFRSKEPVKSMVPYLWFVMVYLALIVFLRVFVGFNSLGDRLLSPIFVPAAIVMTVLASSALDALEKHNGRWAKICEISVLVLVLAWSAGYPARKAVAKMEQDAVGYVPYSWRGYASNSWRDDQIVKYIQNRPLNGDVYSNAPDVMYFFAGKKVRMTPRKFFYGTKTESGDSIDAMAKRASEHDIYIVWFDKSEADYRYSLEDIQSRLSLQNIYSSDDGSVYRVIERNR